MVALPIPFDPSAVSEEDTPPQADIISLSPFRIACDEFIAAGYAVLPIWPGEKKPGKFDGDDWRDLSNWPSFERTQREKPSVLQHWKGFPQAGIGIILGTVIGDHQVIALDFDTDDADELDALQSVIPPSPMKKRGARGFTAFYLAGMGVKTKSFKKLESDGSRRSVLDFLTGNATKQSVMPPSIHPAAGRYEWYAGGRLVPAHELPILEDHDLEKLEDTLAHLGCAVSSERVHPVAANDDRELGGSGTDYFRDINDTALANLDAWVNALNLPKLHRRANGSWAAVADWRPSSTGRAMAERKANLSFHPHGIRDMGTNQGYTACDVVMRALSYSSEEAFGWLADKLGLKEDDSVFKLTLPAHRIVETAEDGTSFDAETGEVLPGPTISDALPRNANDNAAPKRFDATPFKFRDKSLIPRRQWLLGKFALRQEMSITVAPGGVGKTALSHVEGIALASGQNLLGFDVPKPLRVWIWNGEEPSEEMERRLRAITEHYGVTEADIGDRLFVDTEDGVELVLCEQTRNAVELKWPVIDPLVGVLKRRQIDIMIVDPFVTTHNCTENDNNAMEKAAKAWKTVAKRANCAIHLVHHTRKSNGQVVTSDSSRGGDAVASKARAVRALNPLSAKDAKKMGLSRQEGSTIFYHDPSGNKVNMVGRGGACEWYRIVSVPLYNQTVDADDVGDEIGVVTRWAPPESAALSYDEDALAVFKAELATGFYLCAAQSQGNEAWVGHLIARCFEFPEDAQGQWKVRAKAIWKQLVEDGQVRPSQERNAQHQNRTVGRPIYASGQLPSDWEPSED